MRVQQQYRPHNRRQNRTGYVDHDIFEGLPVRHWRRDYVTVAPPPPQEHNTAADDPWAVELPHGMPKDSHLLAQHSQDLLRAARSGRPTKRPAPVEEEEAYTEAALGEKPEKKEDEPKNRGFLAKAWKQIPRHLEGSDTEYLAKRRKGVTTVTKASPSTAVTLTKATVKRLDAAGNEYIQDVVVPQGQQIEGQIIAQTVISDPSTRTSSGGLLAQPTPSRRKGPPKKKSKGTGKRKSKKIPPTSIPNPKQIDGVAEHVEGAGEVVDPSVSLESSSPCRRTDSLYRRVSRSRRKMARHLQIVKIQKWPMDQWRRQTTMRAKKEMMARKELKTTKDSPVILPQRPSLNNRFHLHLARIKRCRTLRVVFRLLILRCLVMARGKRRPRRQA
jgi:hypothetical protein